MDKQGAKAAVAPGRRKSVRWFLGLYAAAAVASWLTMGVQAPEPDLQRGRLAAVTLAFGAEGEPLANASPVRVAYREFGDPSAAEHVLLLHGSPGSLGDFRRLAEPLAAAGHHVIAPDLPGFGSSTRNVPDYSVRAHAAYCLTLLNELGVADAHLVGFSMGGGVALEMIGAAPNRVRSLTMLSAIGVIELELLGSQALNHGIHGLQLTALRALRWLVPHFGALDSSLLSIEYARNFYDTDQRRLRPILEAYGGPALILHGEADFLVPVAAAQEHRRIMPQAKLVVYPAPDGHFLPWKDSTVGPVIDEILLLVSDVAAGRAVIRSAAPADSIARAQEPFDPSKIPPFEGPALLAVLALLAVSTFASEDLACIAAGLLVADGRLGFVPASLACFVGILVGDMLLYLAGRAFGRPALQRRPMSWVVSEAAVERASRWFERRGIAVIFLSRFTPGLRLPTYVAAGVLRTSFRAFAFFFAVAGLLWTPILVGVAALAGERLAEAIGGLGPRQLPWILALIVVLMEAYRTIPLLLTHRGRRVLKGRWRRRTSWEFWPPWITYVPVIAWVLWLAVKHRGLTKVTACNPAMPAGGFVGESKAEIFEGLGPEHPEIPAFALLEAQDSPRGRIAAVQDFMAACPGPGWPVILKPNAGQRGSGVARLLDQHSLETGAAALEYDAIVQACVEGPEFGVFYVRKPGAAEGRVFAVTVKVLPEVIGDGKRTVEDLLLDDDRACALHGTYLEELGPAADQIPLPGEAVPLVKVGTHSRGAIFLEGEHLITPALEAAIELIASRYEGFDFGRFDIRAPSEGHLMAGEGLSVLELNGVTSEATNVYDPKHSVLHAYRVLFRQWDLAYAIGAANAASGAPTTSLWGILRAWSSYRRSQRSHQAHLAAPAGAPGVDTRDISSSTRTKSL